MATTETVAALEAAPRTTSSQETVARRTGSLTNSSALLPAASGSGVLLSAASAAAAMPPDASASGSKSAAGVSAAECALRRLAVRAGKAGERMQTLLPQLWDLLVRPVTACAARVAAGGVPPPDESRAIASSAHLLQCMAPDLHGSAHAELLALRSAFVTCMADGGHPTAMSEALASLAAAQPACHLEPLVATVTTLMDTAQTEPHRHAGAALLTRLLDPAHTLTHPLLPFTPFLAVPALALMPDPSCGVRTLAAAAFGRVVAMLPLAASAKLPPTPSLPPSLRAKRIADGAFLEQLTAARSVEQYSMPVVPAGVTLRAYQREGISWLAFLQRFGLHGILADDMGLGKTIQALSIIVSAMHEAHSCSAADARPSLIICPASLVGHWVAEAERYYGHTQLAAVALQGSMAQRQSLQQRVATGGHWKLVVTSYETVRVSAAWLSGVHFLYCVLDEGHVIRNPKAKTSQACKQVPPFACPFALWPASGWTRTPRLRIECLVCPARINAVSSHLHAVDHGSGQRARAR
jgi:TATA-binding protein-associated factor